ncbi:MAG: hypothetical protein AAB601_01375, partial [Patescibacteria group bacterium]
GESLKSLAVQMAVEALKDGRLVNLSRATIFWYLDNKLISRGEGLKETLFSATRQAGDTHTVRVVAQLPEEERLEASFQVPAGERRLAIGGVSRGAALAPGGQVALEALPYFFNIASVADLTFFWSIGGARQPGITGNTVTMTAPTGERAVEIQLSAQGARDPYEFAQTRILFPVGAATNTE